MLSKLFKTRCFDFHEDNTEHHLTFPGLQAAPLHYPRLMRTIDKAALMPFVFVVEYDAPPGNIDLSSLGSVGLSVRGGGGGGSM